MLQNEGTIVNVFLWAAAAVLAVAVLGAGFMKLAFSKDALAHKGMPLMADFSQSSVRGIGVLEVLGGLGLLLPALVNVAPILVPIAAIGVAIVMAGAVVTHLRHNEASGVTPAAVLLLLALFVAWGRFGAWAF